MKVLVTGSEGYIGSILVPMLIEKGFEVVGLDVCFYSNGNLNRYSFPKYKLIKKDIRDVTLDDLKGQNYDAIIHLAALSNDPLGILNKDLTYEINYKASVNLAYMAKKAGISRFIFASSCSLYGASNKILTEDDEPNPQTPYGKSKILAEIDISKFADETFSPTFMRNATACGFSPRMRFDIVVNNLTGYAQVENEIKIMGDGTPWRPLVHVKDISEAIIKVLQADRKIIHNQTFNVGDSNENYQIKTIAQHIQKVFNCNISIAKKNANDTRNYIVSFQKLNNKLGYKAKYSLDDAIYELKSIYNDIQLTKNEFYHRLYNRLKQIKYLIQNNIIDKNLRKKE